MKKFFRNPFWYDIQVPFDSISRDISNTGVFITDGPVMAELFVILKTIFHIVVLKCMSLCAA